MQKIYVLLLILSLAQTGCAVLFGNVKPVEEKSTSSYGVADLTKTGSGWIKLTNIAEAKDPDATETEISDVGFQNKKTASVISINSACRPSNEYHDQNLVSFTNALLVGISEITLREEKDLTIQNTGALETTVKGKMNGEAMMLKTVVLRRGPCVYDLMYVARPRHFQENEPDFSHFVASLKLK